MASYSSILAWRIPWTEKLAENSPWGHKELDMTEWLSPSPDIIGVISGTWYFKCCHTEDSIPRNTACKSWLTTEYKPNRTLINTSCQSRKSILTTWAGSKPCDECMDGKLKYDPVKDVLLFLCSKVHLYPEVYISTTEGILTEQLKSWQ